MVPEAPLEPTEHGLVPTGDGWFVLNARDARWRHAAGRGARCDFEGEVDFRQLGINVMALEPGEAMAMYHWEADQEDFLVLAGEALLIVEGEERPLREWDLFHCPAETKHVIRTSRIRPMRRLSATPSHATGARNRWSTTALPLAALGSAVFVILPGMEFAPMVAAETGGDTGAAQEELMSWFVPMLLLGAVTFTPGLAFFAIAIVSSGVLSRRLTWVVVPLDAAQIVLGLAAVVASGHSHMRCGCVPAPGRTAGRSLGRVVRRREDQPQRPASAAVVRSPAMGDLLRRNE